MLDHLLAGADDVIAKNTDVRSIQRRGQVDKSLSLRKLLLVLSRITLVQVSRTAQTRDSQAVRRNLFLRLLAPARCKFRPCWQVHRSWLTAHLHASETVRLGE